jgi:predicted dehydrogenase
MINGSIIKEAKSKTGLKKAKLGFIGTGGFISARHLLTARDSRFSEIRAIADLNTATLQKHKSNMEIGYATTNYKEILGDPEIDIVVIGTKQDLHARMIVESLDAGKWVFCEKPMAETKQEIKEVLLAEERNAGKLAIGFNRRFAPACIETKKLMPGIRKPWFINYRLMYPNPEKQGENSFYATQERILYEGCHILDLVCWLLDASPNRVYMTGDPLLNNCCILEYPDGSQVSFMCGSMGTFCLWKEYMEVFSYYHAITVSDFVDMRVRGFKGQFDRVFPPHRNEQGTLVTKYGFDFYETYKLKEVFNHQERYKQNYGMTIEQVQRPTIQQYDIATFDNPNSENPSFDPDKGWTDSFSHFVKCFLNDEEPKNADGKSGALATGIALALLKSLETGMPIDFDPVRPQ